MSILEMMEKFPDNRSPQLKELVYQWSCQYRGFNANTIDHIVSQIPDEVLSLDNNEIFAYPVEDCEIWNLKVHPDAQVMRAGGREFYGSWGIDTSTVQGSWRNLRSSYIRRRGPKSEVAEKAPQLILYYKDLFPDFNEAQIHCLANLWLCGAVVVSGEYYSFTQDGVVGAPHLYLGPRMVEEPDPKALGPLNCWYRFELNPNFLKSEYAFFYIIEFLANLLMDDGYTVVWNENSQVNQIFNALVGDRVSEETFYLECEAIAILAASRLPCDAVPPGLSFDEMSWKELEEKTSINWDKVYYLADKVENIFIGDHPPMVSKKWWISDKS
ncbi:hypothetical protein GSS88_03780 [Corynebacterium sp. 3HC-13]|uniref:hypothetical protein n=1 Tax=Corynebacterium poyangense TaxID=2684405 RepID=UPI001CC97036|nr:hypothetical protein [Corynebacterium poyangense]MBZ8176920.1 hypothetical protein [Corynebacterium poyangense]